MIRLVAILLLSLGPLAHADEPKVEAKRLRDAGVESWEKGEYVEALADFEKAYALYPSANLRFNIARVLADLGRDVEALEAFETFLNEAKDAPEDARALARSRIAILGKRIGKISIRANTPEAEVTVDGRSIGRAPLERSVRVVPGLHQIAAQRAGYQPYLGKTPVLPSQDQRVAIELKKIGADKPLKKKWWFWTTLGVVAAGVATGIALGVVYGHPATIQPSDGVISPQTSAGLADKR